MRFMLDTNICIYLIKKKPIKVLSKLRRYAISDVCISSITLAELEYGVEKSSQPERNRDALNSFVAPLEIVPFDEVAASCYGEIRSELEKKGRMIGSMDLLIAAHAKALSFTLVSNNIREFRRIPKLILENWA